MVDDDLASSGEYLFRGFEVEADLVHITSGLVGLGDCSEALGFAGGFGCFFGAEAFGVEFFLGSLAFRESFGFELVGFGVVDGGLFFFLGGGNFAEGGNHIEAAV